MLEFGFFALFFTIKYSVLTIFSYFLQSVKKHVDHQAEAYVAPRRVMAEANGNAPKKPAVALTANGKPKWGGAEVPAL